MTNAELLFAGIIIGMIITLVILLTKVTIQDRREKKERHE